MMKKLATILLTAALTLGANAQDLDLGSYVYVTKSNVNLRENPSTSSPVMGKADAGSIYRIEETLGDWYRIEVAEGIDSYLPCISANFVNVLKNSKVTDEALQSSFIFDDGANYGMLSFEKMPKDENDNDVYQYQIIIKNKEMVAAGGSGTIENKSGNVISIFGNILQPEDWADYPVVYDKEKGLLWYAGYLWSISK